MADDKKIIFSMVISLGSFFGIRSTIATFLFPLKVESFRRG